MVKPKYMCGAHLRGEHAEIHMFIGALKKQKRMDGFIEEDCLEIISIIGRHKKLAAELNRRSKSGNSHKSWNLPRTWNQLYKIVKYLPFKYLIHTINRKRSQQMLFDRCPDCKARFENSK